MSNLILQVGPRPSLGSPSDAHGQQLITSGKPYYNAFNYLYDIIGIDFTERCHVLFTPVTESRLCSARACCKNVICWNHSPCESFILNLEWKPNTWTLIRVALLVELKEQPIWDICLLPLWYWFQHIIRVYISGNTYRRSYKHVHKHFFWWK